MIDMVNKVCDKKDPLVERRVYMRSESDPKISTEILENEMVGYERMWAAQTKKVRARGGQRSACDKKTACS